VGGEDVPFGTNLSLNVILSPPLVGGFHSLVLKSSPLVFVLQIKHYRIKIRDRDIGSTSCSRKNLFSLVDLVMKSALSCYASSNIKKNHYCRKLVGGIGQFLVPSNFIITSAALSVFEKKKIPKQHVRI
jgi:hypothetical protein